jgi:hypothetical protein
MKGMNATSQLSIIAFTAEPSRGNSFVKGPNVRMTMNPYWIKKDGLRLGIILRPRGQDWLADDISALRRAGVDVVVSALTPAEIEEWGLLNESRCCEHNGLTFLSFPIVDRSVPASVSEFDELIDSVTEYLRKGKAVVVLSNSCPKR